MSDEVMFGESGTEVPMPDWIKEAMERADEPLDPELQPYVHESDHLGFVLQHPLVYDIPYFASRAYRDNDQLKYKKERIREAIAEDDWETFVWLHERPYRSDAMEIAAENISDERYWTMLGHFWLDTENLHANGGLIELMKSDRPGREFLMEDSERYYLSLLDDPVTIWRGYTAGEQGTRRGWAWTTNKNCAAWFARRLTFKGTPKLVSAKVRKSNIIAVFLGRNEQEIVVNPRDLYGLKTEKLPPPTTSGRADG